MLPNPVGRTPIEYETEAAAEVQAMLTTCLRLAQEADSLDPRRTAVADFYENAYAALKVERDRLLALNSTVRIRKNGKPGNPWRRV